MVGGNYGATGVSASGNTNTTKIQILNGTIDGDVYGGGNRNGAGSASKISTVNIAMSGGTVKGSIYGGSNITGTIFGTVNLDVTGGQINNNVYGGGRGGTSTNNYVARDINLTVGTVSTGPNINGSVFGGSAFGNVNGTTQNTGLSAYHTNVTINNGTIGTVFGGGQGNTTYNPYVMGNITVTTNGGTIGTIYGGNDQRGTPNGNVTVNVNNGTIGIIYGGNNAGGTVNNSFVNINGGNITADVYGGGRQANTTTTNIGLNNSANKIRAVYGGGYNANVTTSNITVQGINASEIYGGSNTNGTVSTSNITMNSGAIDTVYGGNNLGGQTNLTKVNINNGTVGTVYGGGNIANTVKAEVRIAGGVFDDVFGGGNAARVNTDTYLSIAGAEILNNAYGGGNEGEVLGNTDVHITDGLIRGSLYAGGNGVTAIVHGSAILNVEGNSEIGTEESVAPNSGCVFGGGNAAATGTVSVNNAISTVNIVGGTIYGNVYGGANTSVVYGTTYVNIGYDAVKNNQLIKSDIYVRGTIFGGGEANASGSEVYDYGFISVTKGIVMNIDGNGHSSFKTQGSIFGSGNASSTSGTSVINIKNYGNIVNPQRNISIQRATTVTLDNSSIVLSGATDRTNEYATAYFTFSRVEELKLKNGSSVYLNYGANLLRKISSLLDVGNTEQKAVVTIDEQTGATTKNVDNRIYLLEGKNLNVATNEQVTAYGEINGMMFLGLYTSRSNPNVTTGLYNSSFNNGELITDAGVFSANGYVLGLHYQPSHDITKDGFYTNYDNEGYIKSGYVGVIPENDLYYMWYVGDILDVTTFEVELTASKYSTFGTAELQLVGFSEPNVKFTVTRFLPGLEENVTLIDPRNINDIASTNTEADTVFGLGMKSGRMGWKTNNYTEFYTAGGGTYSGSTFYNSDNSTYAPSLFFYFYHSTNISQKQDLGSAKIRLEVVKQIDDLTMEVSYIDINITLRTALYQDLFYEAAISPGAEYDFFSTAETNITEKGTFSTYYSLYVDNFSNKYMDEQKTISYASQYPDYEHVLVSTDFYNNPFVYKENTKLTMLDLVTDKMYYYVVTAADELGGKYKYNLSDFIRMGSTNEKYDESLANAIYYNLSEDYVYEKYIIHVSFAGSEVTNNIIEHKLLMELQDEFGGIALGVLAIQRDSTKYSVYVGEDAEIDVSIGLDDNIVYLGNELDIELTTNFVQSVVGGKIIYDTEYFDKKMGIKISLIDGSGKVLNGEDLLGVTFLFDGVRYYPRIDGTTRIKLADRLSDASAGLIVDTGNNTTLETGTYQLKIEAFASPDGIYYGDSSLFQDTEEIIIINGAYGLKVSTDENSKIIDKVTGKTDNDNNLLSVNWKYDSQLSNPNVRIVLERRKYDSYYSLQYEEVDLADYVTNTLTPTSNALEYLVSTTPQLVPLSNTFVLNLNESSVTGENLITGTYKITFRLYDNDVYIGDAYEHIIIK